VKPQLRVSPGNTAWLIAQELRLTARSLMRTRAGRGVVGLLAVLFVALHGVYGYLFHMDWLHGWVWMVIAVGPGSWLLVGTVAWVALTTSVTSLFGSRDLDLLLTSPVSPRKVFAVRGLTLAIQLLLPLLFLLAPLAHVGLFFGQARLLAIYPALAGLALLSTALGMGLALVLVAGFGERRTQQGLRALGAWGIVVFYGLVPAHFQGLQLAANTGNSDGLENWLGLPAQALAGAPLPLLAVVMTGALAFSVVTRFATNRFVQSAREWALDPSQVCSSTRRKAAAHFHAGLALPVLLKEWRLLARQRDTLGRLWPLWLCVALGVQLRGAFSSSMAPLIFGLAAVYTATALAGGLAVHIFADEEAPALLECTPVRPWVLRALKLLAAALPAWLLSSPMWLFVLYRQPSTWGWLVPGFLVGTLATGCVGMYSAPGTAVRNTRAHLGAKFVFTLLHNALSLAWLALIWRLAMSFH
jgi:ABC-2 type transport system permease protein